MDCCPLGLALYSREERVFTSAGPALSTLIAVHTLATPRRTVKTIYRLCLLYFVSTADKRD